MSKDDFISYYGKGIGLYGGRESWDSYIDRLCEHFAAVGMKNTGQQKSVLINTVWPEVYDIMKNSLEVQKKPSQKSLDHLVAIVKIPRCPTPPWQSERLKFLNRNQDVNRKAFDGSPNPETVMEYVTELRKLAATCRFSQGEYKDRLRDRILHGVGSESMQMEMIKVGDEMTFDTTLAAALRVEAAGDSLKVISQKEVGATISQDTANRLTHRNDKTKECCWRCGGRHDPSECKLKETTCYRCKQKGHIQSKCRSVGEKHGESSEKRGKHQKCTGRSRGATNSIKCYLMTRRLMTKQTLEYTTSGRKLTP